MGASPALDQLLWGVVGAILLPAWMLAGLADYLIHARLRIELHAGVRESFYHLVLTLLSGVAVLMVLFLQFTAPVFLAVFAAVATHTATFIRDTRYADAVRHIPPAEQFVHEVLDLVPWFALVLLVILHWADVAPLVLPGEADWALRLRQPMFPSWVVGAVLAGAMLTGVLPALLELLRAHRHAPAYSMPRQRPPEKKDAGTGPAS